MARTDANPPMPDFVTDYVLQEVDPAFLTQAVKPKQFLHIDQAECILCEGCVDICPWKCIHMVSVDAIDEAVEHRAARRGPPRPRRVHRRRGRVHPVRALRRPLPHRRDHPRQAHRRRSPTATRTPAPTGTATPTACGSNSRRTRQEQLVANGNGSNGNGRRHRRKVPSQHEARREGPRLAGVDLDLPARLDLPPGLHRQPPEPLLRDHEQRAVPPSPGEGEAARGEGVATRCASAASPSSCSSCSPSPASS